MTGDRREANPARGRDLICLEIPAPACCVPTTGMNREQATAWLLARCPRANELDADQALDDA